MTNPKILLSEPCHKSRHNHLQRTAVHSEFDGCPTHVLAVSVDIHGTLRLNPGLIDGEVLDLSNTDMSSDINGWKQAHQLDFIHVSDQACVKQPIIHFCARRNAHPSAVKRRVREDSR